MDRKTLARAGGQNQGAGATSCFNRLHIAFVARVVGDAPDAFSAEGYRQGTRLPPSGPHSRPAGLPAVRRPGRSRLVTEIGEDGSCPISSHGSSSGALHRLPGRETDTASQRAKADRPDPGPAEREKARARKRGRCEPVDGTAGDAGQPVPAEGGGEPVPADSAEEDLAVHEPWQDQEDGCRPGSPGRPVRKDRARSGDPRHRDRRRQVLRRRRPRDRRCSSCSVARTPTATSMPSPSSRISTTGFRMPRSTSFSASCSPSGRPWTGSTGTRCSHSARPWAHGLGKCWDAVDTEVLGLREEIRALLDHETMSDARKLDGIRTVLDRDRERAADILREGIRKGASDDEGVFQDVLEHRSVRLQNRISPILKRVEFVGDASMTDLMAALACFRERDGSIGPGMPLAFLTAVERDAVSNGPKGFRVSLCKVYLFQHVAAAIKAGSLNLEGSYKYRPLDELPDRPGPMGAGTADASRTRRACGVHRSGAGAEGAQVCAGPAIRKDQSRGSRRNQPLPEVQFSGQLPGGDARSRRSGKRAAAGRHAKAPPGAPVRGPGHRRPALRHARGIQALAAGQRRPDALARDHDRRHHGARLRHRRPEDGSDSSTA